MTLPEMYLRLNDTKKDRVYNTLLNAGVAYDVGGNWRGVFRLARSVTMGIESKIYHKMSLESGEAIERMVNGLVDYK